MDEVHLQKTGWMSLAEAMGTVLEEQLGSYPENTKNPFVVVWM